MIPYFYLSLVFNPSITEVVPIDCFTRGYRNTPISTKSKRSKSRAINIVLNPTPSGNSNALP